MASSMSLDDTSSDDSTYSSQYQSDANSTPRTGTSQTLPRNLAPKHSGGTHGPGGMGVISNVKVKSMNDYEAEILHMRSEMEHLQIKLSEAERRLQFSSNNNSQPQQIPTPTPGEFKIPEIPEIPDQIQKMAKEVVQRLTEDEEKLRNDFVLGAPSGGLATGSNNPDGSDCNLPEPITDKEKMIFMQQKKIAALDAANRRLLDELNKISSNSGPGTNNTGTLGSRESGSGGSSAKVSVTTSPINVTSINTSSNTVSHDRRVSSSSTSSNKSITVITNGEATITSGSGGGGGSVSPTNQNSPVKSTANQQASNSLPAQPTGGAAGSQEIPKRVEELLDSLHSTSI